MAQQVPVKMHDERFALPKKPHSGGFITVVFVFVYVFGVLGSGQWIVGKIRFSSGKFLSPPFASATLSSKHEKQGAPNERQ